MAGKGALAAAHVRKTFTVKSMKMPLAAVKVWKGSPAFFTSGYVTGTPDAGLSTIGVFTETVDNSGGSAGDLSATVEFPRELNCEWVANGTSGDAVARAHVGSLCFWIDNQTVSNTDSSGTRTAAGIVINIDTNKGVCVCMMPLIDLALTAPTITSFANAPHTHADAANGGTLTSPVISGFGSATHNHTSTTQGGLLRSAVGTMAWTGSTCTIASPSTNTVYMIPECGATNRAVVLGATGAVAGDCVKILANGVLNGTATVTYYDAGGGTPVAKTSAMTAARGHKVTADFDGSEWIFNAYLEAN